MRRSFIIALCILFGLIGYFLIQAGMRYDATAEATIAATPSVIERQAEADQKRPSALIEVLRAEPHPVLLTLKGRTEPNRMVTVRSATTGMVIGAPDLEGRSVSKGALLCRLDVDAREARIAEAEAMLNAQQVDYEAAQTLVDKGWAAPTRANSAKAARDAAQATLNAARIELDRTRIKAPFAGVFETRLAETGDFLTPGGACGVIAELNPIRVVAEVTEDYATALAIEAPVTASIIGAGTVDGKISYVARTANPQTRTFRVEATIDNADGRISAGLTSDIKIGLGEADATKVASAMLSLHDDGRLGVRHLDADNRIVFSEVTIIDDASNGVWVTGLPTTATVVAVGQDYLAEGVIVTPTPLPGTAQ